MRICIKRGGRSYPLDVELSGMLELEEFLRGFDAGHRGGESQGSPSYEKGYGLGYQAAENDSARSTR